MGLIRSGEEIHHDAEVRQFDLCTLEVPNLLGAFRSVFQDERNVSILQAIHCQT